MNDVLIERFGSQGSFTVADVFRFYSEQNKAVSRTTVNWRLHSLEQSGAIQRVGRGVYRLGKSNPFQVELSPKMKKIARKIKREFPYTNFCVWEYRRCFRRYY